MVYQLLHPWHWLTYGQNASALQALAAVVATVAAIGAALYAKGAFQEAKEQVSVANRQLDIAREQAAKDVERLEMERASHARSEQQLQIALEEARANRERDARAREENRLRRIAEEDRTRPRFRINYHGSPANFDIGLENVGSTVARNIECRDRKGNLLATSSAVQPDARLNFGTPQSVLEGGFVLKFETDQGSTFLVDLKLGRRPEEAILSAARGY